MNLTKHDKKSTEIFRLFEEKDAKFLSKIMDLALNFAKEVVQIPKPVSSESKNKLEWINYISNFYNHGLPKNIRSTKFDDTTSERLKNLLEIEKYLGYKPTSEDFKTTFKFNIEDGSCRFYKGIDKDIENLLGKD